MCSHVLEVWGPIPWSYCTEQNTDSIPSFVHCSLLCNGSHTLYQNVGWSVHLLEGVWTSPTPSGCALVTDYDSVEINGENNSVQVRASRCHKEVKLFFFCCRTSSTERADLKLVRSTDSFRCEMRTHLFELTAYIRTPQNRLTLLTRKRKHRPPVAAEPAR